MANKESNVRRGKLKVLKLVRGNRPSPLSGAGRLEERTGQRGGTYNA